MSSTDSTAIASHGHTLGPIMRAASAPMMSPDTTSLACNPFKLPSERLARRIASPGAVLRFFALVCLFVCALACLDNARSAAKCIPHVWLPRDLTMLSVATIPVPLFPSSRSNLVLASPLMVSCKKRSCTALYLPAHISATELQTPAVSLPNPAVASPLSASARKTRRSPRQAVALPALL